LRGTGSAEADLHKELLRNVVVTGGGACMSGMPERLEAELKVTADRYQHISSIKQQAHRATVHCGSLTERRHGAWIGGSILASMGSHHEIWMSRDEYDEHGAGLITRKGFQYNW